MVRKSNIVTNNREIYDKFNMLNFSNEVLLKNVKPVYVNKLLKNINKKEKIIDMEKIGDYLLLKKKKTINLNVYLR